MDGEGRIKLFFAGDLMAGRGIDQLLPHPNNPHLFESWVRDARQYVALAERRSGIIPRPVGLDYIWGDALRVLDEEDPDIRLANLETAITEADDPWPGKGIHYRMSPRNAASLSLLALDCCVLANNHVLDWGYAGLSETLQVLDRLGISHSGAGKDGEEAATPAILNLPAGRRVLVFSIAFPSAGVPRQWAATSTRSGVFHLPDLSAGSLHTVVREIRRHQGLGDVIVTSLHWGPNWGYAVEPAQRHFARGLIEAGIDLVYGHSSHHPIGMEVYRGRLICYGCGDFLNDYEGIQGHELYRPHLSLLYFLTLEADGALDQLRIVPLQMRRLSLHHADIRDVLWLTGILKRESEHHGLELRRVSEADRRYPVILGRQHAGGREP
ncbi:CapA family protein [Gilvimarinus sp. F26214L]|uniref:CapA family protein n=1 Tax=Gilvimarinus sp. DZF01 TaxID=3461371 RepID=UPI004045B8A3